MRDYYSSFSKTFSAGLLMNYPAASSGVLDPMLRNKAYTRYVWAFLIFFFIPTILVYLPKYGFKKK
jgi:hypothetical protein